jgi:hypothetical protein
MTFTVSEECSPFLERRLIRGALESKVEAKLQTGEVDVTTTYVPRPCVFRAAASPARVSTYFSSGNIVRIAGIA